ncbi:MAG: TrbC/VirB2 family protein [Clostridia bacterium]|nr:TrbC/VirB2 family protein [Clostridia bacterium]
MKKTVKILTLLLIVITLISFTTNVFAATGTQVSPSDLESKIDYGDTNDTNDLMTKAGKIMGMIRNISVIAAVIIIMILGVKYMLGSVEEKAEYKKSFMPLIIGIILVVAASSIATFIFGLVG